MSADTNDLPPLAVSPAKAAHLLGIGRTHLYELINTGALRSVRLGKRRLIPIDAIRQCLAVHEVRS
jgi:excisionase family DNA binding protein